MSPSPAAPWTTVALQAARPQPWRSGAGVTRELLAWPSAEDARLHLCVDDVHTASALPRREGSERWLAVLEGEGVLLRVPKARHRLTRAGEPLRLDAGIVADCKPLRGPARDLHLLAMPGRAVLLRVRGELTFATGGLTLLAVYAHTAAARISAGPATLSVPAYHLGWVLQEEPLAGIVAGADALWLEATP
ncbi:HutD family protein [Ramlibacter sp.]|uniref:HutD family protein n=1 Tax=Ramlibacter sp. TaxID=1917967 RepID=UPI0026377B1F|nr:HutD family protein [Ramlibacter sp.]MDB5956755.1 HutD family protein [Ramlibacter sp.]